MGNCMNAHTVSAVIYSEDPGDGGRPLPVGEEHDDADGLR